MPLLQSLYRRITSASPRVPTLRTQTELASRMGASLKSFLVTAAAFFAVLAIGVSPASAATPCWKTLLNDWYDGHIDHYYPSRCYQQAIDHVPQDVQIYGNIAEDLR